MCLTKNIKINRGTIDNVDVIGWVYLSIYQSALLQLEIKSSEVSVVARNRTQSPCVTGAFSSPCAVYIESFEGW